MILGQPIHTDDNVETTKFNWHKIDFERLIYQGGIFSIKGRDVDMKLLSAPESNNTLGETYPSGSICFDNFLTSVLLWLVIIVVVVRVGVTVVVIVAVIVVVESSSVVKLSFMIT
ncbi:hypothetical protein Tco_1084153 [Tanacetum coccineum]